MELDDILVGYEATRTPHGRAGETFRLTAPDRPTRYLKIAPELHREHARLEWLATRFCVPRIVAFDDRRLLLDELPGVPLADATDLPIATRIAILAEALCAVHALDARDCPFDARVAARLADADARVRAGLVDETDFDPERAGRSAASVLAELLATPRIAEDLVVAHGDFTLDNVIVAEGAFAGMVDVGRLGVGDRFADLALAARDVAGDYGPRWVDELFAAYGASPDPMKLRYFQLLDELF